MVEIHYLREIFMTDGVIEHTGCVVSVDGGHAVVKVLQTSACAACKAKKFCQSNENKEKLVDVFGVDDKTIKIGDEVTVCATASMGRKALVLAYVLPLLVLIGVLSIVLWITDNEPLACLVGIGALIPYYIVLYLMKDRIQRKFVFWIKGYDNENDKERLEVRG